MSLPGLIVTVPLQFVQFDFKKMNVAEQSDTTAKDLHSGRVLRKIAFHDYFSHVGNYRDEGGSDR